MAIKEVNQDTIKECVKEGFVIVDAYGDGCAPCMMLAKVLEELYYEMPFLEIVKINTTHNVEFARENSISAVPTLILMKDGVEISKEIGFKPIQALREVVAQNLY